MESIGESGVTAFKAWWKSGQCWLMFYVQQWWLFRRDSGILGCFRASCFVCTLVCVVCTSCMTFIHVCVMHTCGKFISGRRSLVSYAVRIQVVCATLVWTDERQSINLMTFDTCQWECAVLHGCKSITQAFVGRHVWWTMVWWWAAALWICN